MKTIFLSFFTALYSATLLAQLNYPTTPKIEIGDTLWGTVYKDNYRWLEDMKDPKVIDWFKQQAELSDSVMNAIPGRDELISEWRKLEQLQPAEYYPPIEANGRFFFQKSNPNDIVSKVYYRDSLNGEDKLLFDPVTLIPGKTFSIESIKPSYDGKLLLISYAEQGAEIYTLRVLDVDAKKFLPDVIPASAYVSDWSYDNTSFLYLWTQSADIMDPNALLNAKTKLHRLGTDVGTDIDFFSNESYPSLNMDASVYPAAFLLKDAKDYIFAMEQTVQNELKEYYAPIDQFNSGNIQWKTLCTPADKLVGNIEIFDGRLYAKTYKNADNYQIISTDLRSPDWGNAEIVAPERPMKLDAFARCKDFFLLNYSDGINNYLYKYNPKTKKTSEIELPFNGSVFFQGLDTKSNGFLIGITSWNQPFTEFLFNAETDKFLNSPFNKASIYPEVYTDLVVEEVEVKGHDDVMIPLSIIYKKGIKRDGSNVCYISAYGAYGIPSSPGFGLFAISLAAKGVVLAIPHVRGGGEKGENWYKAGFKTTKPNTWKDFISCAEYMIAQGFTSPGKLGGKGTSAGGILISRAVTERPDLFAAAVCNVGWANAMRIESSANGPANSPEFGTVKDSIETKALYEMDGMHHVRDGVKYPAVMCVAGWNDLRVVAWQPAKFAAVMQNSSASRKPILLKVNYDNGHFTEDKEVTWANFADQYTFLMWQCGHPDFQPRK